ncbi:pyrroline-5-carboxylate reductase [Hathewaya limosa]|uniref:Pyrroline-5-carboxylate reductase n=1 Tax=Hathewaya limosa TaxID=1536 RepID=A0ABU0JQH8_HATLI|nr:pyrroline-5-carboxylate reductase [Hathewaya limosa]MDQ0478314.1 pyrroline-5-carboxylate reductase [Hathewaya limosa]
MSFNISFIGCGNMGRAMIGGIINSGIVKPQEIFVADLFVPSLEKVKEKYGANTTVDNIEVSKKADVLILAVKPNILSSVASEIKNSIKKDTIIISIVAGKTIANLEEYFGNEHKIVRTMPNTPALVGEGMAAVCGNKNINDDDLNKVKSIFSSFGKVEVIPEKLIDAFVSLSGSSPAYIFMLIEAMADAAVYDGMPRDKAYKIAAQAVLGSAKMVLETGKHPAQLKDMVCSPAGTTIEAVEVLEENGFRSSIMKAMKACTNKCKDMSK